MAAMSADARATTSPCLHDASGGGCAGENNPHLARVAASRASTSRSISSAFACWTESKTNGPERRAADEATDEGPEDEGPPARSPGNRPREIVSAAGNAEPRSPPAFAAM